MSDIHTRIEQWQSHLLNTHLDSQEGCEDCDGSDRDCDCQLTEDDIADMRADRDYDNMIDFQFDGPDREDY